jgi:EmrB/QacA subfamily drug resistance transporter
MTEHVVSGTEPVVDNRRWKMLALLAVAFFMTVLDGTSLLTALPSIERHLSLDTSAVQWTVTIYALAFSGPLLFFGRAADLLGRRRMFLTGMALRVVAALLCGLAPTAAFLVAARALQGLSAAIIAPSALSMVMNAFPDGAERNKALGIWGGLGGVGATAGLLLGGVITDALGWQWVFWINIPVGVVVLLIGPGLLRESRDRARATSFDLAGALTITAALVLGVYTITRIPVEGLLSARTGTALVVTAALVWLFVAIERRSAQPLLPMRLLRSRSLIGGNLLILIAGMSVDGMLITLTAYVQQVLGWSAVRFGLVAAVMTVMSVVGALLSQRIVTKIGARPVAAVGTVLLGGGCLLLTRTSAAGSLGIVLVALLAFGAGMGAAAVCAQITALHGIAEQDSGIGAGLADTSFALGTAIGVAVCTSVAAAATPALAGPGGLVSGEHTAFTVAAGFAAAGLVITLTLVRPLSHHRAAAAAKA